MQVPGLHLVSKHPARGGGLGEELQIPLKDLPPCRVIRDKVPPSLDTHPAMAWGCWGVPRVEQESIGQEHLRNLRQLASYAFLRLPLMFGSVAEASCGVGVAAAPEPKVFGALLF